MVYSEFKATKIACLWKDVSMSRIDVFGDRICVVTSLLIVGWFIYNVAFSAKVRRFAILGRALPTGMPRAWNHPGKRRSASLKQSYLSNLNHISR